MSDLLFYVPISMIAFFVFLFTFWKNLKDDYIPSQVFTTAFYAIVFAVAGYGFSYFAVLYRFWIITISFALGFAVGSKKKGIKINEGIDAVVASILITILISVPVLIKLWRIEWIVFYGGVILCVGVYFLVKRYYKSFVWYRSGRRGFSAFFTMGLFFLLRSVISIIKPEFTLMQTEYDIFISGLISLISFLNIFILSK